MFISRQKAVFTAALCLAVGISSTDARADNSVIKSDEQLVYTLHTHLTSPSWRLPSSDEIKLAAVCFISDTKNCSDGMFGYGEEISGGDAQRGGQGGQQLHLDQLGARAEVDPVDEGRQSRGKDVDGHAVDDLLRAEGLSPRKERLGRPGAAPPLPSAPSGRARP